MYEKFKKLLDSRGVTPYRVSKETGLSTATLSDWKNRKSVPKRDKIEKICEYFNVSPSYHYIYEQLPDGVLEELKQKTPKNKRLHQSLTDEVGIPHLDKKLQKTIGLMQASDSWEEFEALFAKAMKRSNT